MERLDNVVPAFEQGSTIGQSVAGNLAFGYGMYKAYQYGLFSVSGAILGAAAVAIGYSAAKIAEAKKFDDNDERSVLDVAKATTGTLVNASRAISGVVTGSIFATKQLLLPRPTELREENDDAAKQGTAFFRNVLQVAIPVGLGLGLASLAPSIGLGLTSFSNGPKICRLGMMFLGGFAGTKAIESPVINASIGVMAETGGSMLWAIEKVKSFAFGIKDTAVEAHASAQRIAHNTRQTVAAIQSAANTVNQVSQIGRSAPASTPLSLPAPLSL